MRIDHFSIPLACSLIFACSAAEEPQSLEPNDAGTVAPDAGPSDASTDAGTDADGGADSGLPPSEDAGTPSPDAGAKDEDAGSEGGDAGEPTDAGPIGPSDGECPDMSGSGVVTGFLSGGQMRNVAVVFPENLAPNSPVIFFFHGITAEQPVQAVLDTGLQALANEHGTIFVVPEATEQSIPMLGNFQMWGLIQSTETDLQFFDDLRICVTQELNADPDRITAAGQDVGGIWTSILLFERSADLAAAAEFSGGSDISLFVLTIAEYATPAAQLPVLLFSGGPGDALPPSQPLLSLEDSTDSLQGQLVDDGHTVIRCRHDLGVGRLPEAAIPLAVDFLNSHTRGEASTFLPDGIAEHQDWCEQID